MAIDRNDRAVTTVDRHGALTAVRTYNITLPPVCGNDMCMFRLHAAGSLCASSDPLSRHLACRGIFVPDSGSGGAKYEIYREKH